MFQKSLSHKHCMMSSPCHPAFFLPTIEVLPGQNGKGAVQRPCGRCGAEGFFIPTRHLKKSSYGEGERGEREEQRSTNIVGCVWGEKKGRERF